MRLAEVLLIVSATSLASWVAPRSAAAEPAAARAAHGRPTVKLDRLDLSAAPLARLEEKFLRDVLSHEAKRVDWGVGKKSTIEYRFRVEELVAKSEGKVFRVSCTASGWLPKGRPVNSRVSFGGAPEHRDDILRQVLQIVSRGVMTRLAEMERKRRHLED